MATNPLVYAVPGAAAGLVVGGPIGAAVGGAAGLLLSFVGGAPPPQQRRGTDQADDEAAGGIDPEWLAENEECLKYLPSVDPAQLYRDGLSACDLIEQSSEYGVDPESIRRGKGGFWSGGAEDRPVLIGCAEGQDCTGAGLIISSRYEEQRRKNPDFDVDSYTRGLTYESLRRRGLTHEQSIGTNPISEISYEFCIYDEGRSEAECNWKPLDKDIDKAEAWDYIASRFDMQTGMQPTYNPDAPRACTKYFHCADDEYCDGGICFPYSRRRVCPDDAFTIAYNMETCPGEAKAPPYPGERQAADFVRQTWNQWQDNAYIDPRLDSIGQTSNLISSLYGGGDEADPLANLRSFLGG